MARRPRGRGRLGARADARLRRADARAPGDRRGLEDAGALAGVVQWLEATIEVRGLIDELEGSTARIADLAGAIKEYASMDRAPQEVDLHEGLESRAQAPSPQAQDGDRGEARLRPRPAARPGAGRRAQPGVDEPHRQRDRRHGRQGAPDRPHPPRRRRRGGRDRRQRPRHPAGDPRARLRRLLHHQGGGKGTGLGLDIVRRIVEARHKGEIAVESRPGETRFTVRLPIAGAGSAARPSGLAEKSRARG